mgnify:CR=1 FL=1
MPKRSRFMAIPPREFGYYLGPDLTERLRRHAQRVARSVYPGFGRGGPEPVAWEPRFYVLMRDMIMTLGTQTDQDRAYWAYLTGRLAYLQRAFREVLDRRRRQAYLLLRRVLPMELAGPIVLNYS